MNLMKKTLNTEKKRQLYHNGWVRFLLSEAICEYMNDHSISRDELAQRLKKPVSYVNKILDQERNMDIDVFANILFALDCEFNIKLVGKADDEKPFFKCLR